MVSQIRGYRNHNPGNIRENQRVDYDWEGEARADSDGEFEEFDSPEFGIRAMARILKTYNTRHDLKTVRAIINRWAPPSENHTESYIRAVCLRMGITEQTRLNLTNNAVALQSLIKSVIHHELGCQPYSDELIDTGIRWERDGVPGSLR
ncbi:structural protein [Sansalvadorimonas verongulae]|uniref:structural protein n=1 Tax=Sansalvadorimonas verongulae TaxID=2172824 RepID=UPI0012BC3EED|nr:structural protein [Sansalvadorimonas verongulae]MTI12003.1 structural protein [Sansalvadorimonas verongulae]